MLKKVHMAKATAKFMLPEIIKEFKSGKDNKIVCDQQSILKVLEEVYIGGYDLAVEECHKDNSKPGVLMAEYLETLGE